MSTDTRELKALDVWLRFYDPAEDENGEEYLAESEANTFEIDGEFVVQWYHNDVGLVSEKWFTEYEDAIAWLDSEGFEDFSPGEE